MAVVWVNWKEWKERVVASGSTEWAEGEVKENGEPEMDFRPIWGGIPGKLIRQRDLLKFCEEGDKVFQEYSFQFPIFVFIILTPLSLVSNNPKSPSFRTC